MLTLYGVVDSRAIRCLWMLEELALAYRQAPVSHIDGSTREAAFLRLNPNGHIPVLEDGEVVVWESMAINLYLAQRYPGPLSARDAAEQAGVLMWSLWVVTEVESALLDVLRHRRTWPAERRDANVAEAGVRRLHGPLSVLEQTLTARGGLAADRFTVADLNVAAVLSWARAARLQLADWPHLDGWLDAALRRPAFARARGARRSSG